MKQAGRIVICYFSAGTWESYRPDTDEFPPAVKGNSLDPPFDDERWLDIRRLDILGPIMGRRLDLARSKGCDGVDPDNVDGYTNNTGFPLTYAQQIAYNTFIANAAHARGLSVGLKNDLDQVPDLVGVFDWALNEQCFQFNECALLAPFINAGKAVFELAEARAQDSLVLIGRRELRSNNSWMHNVPRLIKGRPRHHLLMHADDLARRGIPDGARVRVRSQAGSIEVEAQQSDAIMPGVACLPHGYGHDRGGARQSRAIHVEGASYNDLTDPAALDAPSGNAALSGVAIWVEAIGS